jgi:hypothetical protein
MKQQFVITHTNHHTETAALLDSWVTNTPSIKMSCLQKNCFFLYFHKNITCVIAGQIMSYQVSYVSYKIVYEWVTTHC